MGANPLKSIASYVARTFDAPSAAISLSSSYKLTVGVRLKMDPHLTQGGSIFNGEKWTGGRFSTVENGPGGTFLGGSIFNLTPAIVRATMIGR